MKSIDYVLLIVGFFVISCAFAASTTVYEKTTPEGVPEFSDQPSRGAVPEKVETPNLMKPVETEMPVEVPASRTPGRQSKEAQLTVSVTKPVAQQSVWSGNGDIDVSYRTSALPAGFHYQIVLDSQLQETTTQENTVLHNVFRGQHRLQVKVVNPTGTAVSQSKIIIFYVHRPIDKHPATRFHPNAK